MKSQNAYAQFNGWVNSTTIPYKGFPINLEFLATCNYDDESSYYDKARINVYCDDYSYSVTGEIVEILMEGNCEIPMEFVYPNGSIDGTGNNVHSVFKAVDILHQRDNLPLKSRGENSESTH